MEPRPASDESKGLFARLSVFAGSFSLAASEEVRGRPRRARNASSTSGLLKPIGDDRFLLLETIREFAREQLEATGGADECQRRHAEFLAQLAEEAYHRFDAEEEWSARLEPDHDDLRAALEWRAEHDPPARWIWPGARLVLPRTHIWRRKRRLEEALARFEGAGRARARALTWVGAIAGWLGDVELGDAKLREGIARWRELGDEAEAASALDLLGWSLFHFLSAGRDEESLAAFEESLAIRRQLGDRAGELRALAGVCQLLVAMGEVDRAGRSPSSCSSCRAAAISAPSTLPTTTWPTVR